MYMIFWCLLYFFFFKQKTAYEMRISDWSSDVCSSDLFEDELAELPKEIIMYEINGPLFFGASKKFQDIITGFHQKPKILILRMRHVPFIDATGVSSLKSLCTYMRSKGSTILISGANREVRMRSEEQTFELKTIIRKS